MKKIPKSITVTVRHRLVNGDNRLTVDGVELDTELSLVKEAFKNVPSGDYKVAYSANKSGRYIVNASNYMEVHSSKSGGLVKYVCFLPRSWHGLRVSRKVTPIRGKK